MKFRKSAFALALCLALLPACGGGAAEPEAPASGDVPVQALKEPPGGAEPSLAEDEEPTVLACRIVDGGAEGELLLAKLCRCPGADVYLLPVGDIPVTLDGEPAGPSVLEDGMCVEVAFNGLTLETFPAQMGEAYGIRAYSIGTEKNPGGACYDLCGLYLQVLDDLWEKDPGLNEGIRIAGLDLSAAPGGLAESEKAAIAWRFGEKHGVETVMGSFEELEEQGYFTATAISTPAPGEGEDYSRTWLAWEDGCLFAIEGDPGHEGEAHSLPVVHFNAGKWRTPLGAYYFDGCIAAWPELGAWNGYSIAAEMIS